MKRLVIALISLLACVNAQSLESTLYKKIQSSLPRGVNDAKFNELAGNISDNAIKSVKTINRNEIQSVANQVIAIKVG